MGKYDVKSDMINIVRQPGTNNFYASWDLPNKQKKLTIKKKLYDTNKKKMNTKATSKYFYQVISEYTVKWYYKVNGSGTSYLDKTITVVPITSDAKKTACNTTSDLWSPPDGATQISVSIKPNSKEYKANKSSNAKWFSAAYVTKLDNDYDEIPSAPSVGDFSITNLTVKAAIEFGDVNNALNKIQIQILLNGKDYVKFGNNNFYQTTSIPSTGFFNFSYTLSKVGSYQLRARVASTDSGKDIWSEWSSWSSSIDTRPKTPTLNSATAMGNDKIKLSWSSVSGITKYEIEYVTDSSSYFNSNQVTTASVENMTSYIIGGLEAGHTYYFRIRSENGSDKSDPSNVKTAVLATRPSAPSTWSSSTNAVIATDISTTDPLYIYWVHNSQDGSAQRSAKLQFIISGVTYHLYKENTEKDEVTGELIDKTTELDLWRTTLYRTEGKNTNPAGTVFDIFSSGTGNSIKWKACTKGIHSSYSDWSTEREINVYIRPNLQLTVSDASGNPLSGDILTSFPLMLKGQTTPTSQTPISYHISIIAGATYQTTDIYGEDMTVSEGSEVYSKYLDTNEQLSHLITASDVDFAANVPYTLRVIAYMDSGLNAEASYDLSVEWEEISDEPEADIMYNTTYRYADIRPFCQYYIGYNEDDESDYEPVAYIGTAVTGTSEDPVIFSGTGITNAAPGDMYFNKSTFAVYTCTLGGGPNDATWVYRTTFDFSDAVSWYSGTAIDVGSEDNIYPDSRVSNAKVNDFYFNTSTGSIFKCVKAGTPYVAEWEYVWSCFWAVTPNITLSIYRRDAKGSYIAIREGINNEAQATDNAITVRDYHPSFNTCVYRIVATNTVTGGIAYTDYIENFRETSVIIQWDETWRDPEEDYSVDDTVEVFDGSILELPANVQLTDKNNVDVTLAQYIGRSRPVSYYGTQMGESASISCVFPKSDTATLKLLRRLMNYQGDVYVREPSGLGYWARVTVSYKKNYNELTIPVSLDITPVEGGI